MSVHTRVHNVSRIQIGPLVQVEDTKWREVNFMKKRTLEDGEVTEDIEYAVTMFVDDDLVVEVLDDEVD